MPLMDLVTGRNSTFRGGVHPADEKNLSRDAEIEVIATPVAVVVPLLQHLGSACGPTVAPRQEVEVGDLLGDSEAFLSAPVHASVSGRVSRPSVTTLPNGRHVATVPITAGEQTLTDRALYDDVLGGSWPRDEIGDVAPGEIIAAVRAAGLVGMGGAGFPTYVKLMRRDDRPVDTVLINGCECEPYITADFRVMIEGAPAVVAGALLARRAAGAERVVIGIEDNKEEAFERLREAASGTRVDVRMVPTKYPQGAEKQLVFAALGRQVPAGGLPLDVGVVVLNVETAAAIARAVMRGKPLTHRVVTVTGRGVERPRNLLVPIGTRYADLVAAAGGLTAEARRVLAGGPMMGFTIADLETPVTKGTGAVTVLTESDLVGMERTGCVRCGRCVDVCPLRLVPTKIAIAARRRAWDVAKRYHISDCMECGCCAFACPAQIPLVQLIRAGKAEMAA